MLGAHCKVDTRALCQPRGYGSVVSLDSSIAVSAELLHAVCILCISRVSEVGVWCVEVGRVDVTLRYKLLLAGFLPLGCRGYRDI